MDNYKKKTRINKDFDFSKKCPEVRFLGRKTMFSYAEINIFQAR